MNYFFYIILILAFYSSSSQAAMQDRIAAIVNNEPILLSEVLEHMVLYRRSLGINPQDSPDSSIQQIVLDMIIDNKLRVQEARRVNLLPNQNQIDAAFSNLARSNNIPIELLPDFLRQQNLSLSTVKNNVISRLYWSLYIEQYLRPQIIIGSEEVDEAIEYYKSSIGSPEYLISEIFIARDNINSDESEALARFIFDKLEKADNIATSFPLLAVRYSQALSAPSGGLVGWLADYKIDIEARNTLNQLNAGEVSAPINLPEGSYIFMLHDKRLIGIGTGLSFDLRLLFLSTNEQSIAKQETILASLKDSLQGECISFEERKKSFADLNVRDYKNLEVSVLPKETQILLKDMQKGDISDPVLVEATPTLLKICEREEAEVKIPERKVFIEDITNNELDRKVRKTMRDLRNRAYIAKYI